MGLVMQDFMCKDMFGNICATVTSSTLEQAKNVFDTLDWGSLYVADEGTTNFRLIGVRGISPPPSIKTRYITDER